MPTGKMKKKTRFKQIKDHLMTLIFGKIKRKIFLGFLISSLIPLVVVGYFSFRISNDALSQNTLNGIEESTQIRAQEISTILKGFRSEVIFLSKTSPIQGIIRARENQGIDSFDNSSYQQWRDRLANIFREIIISGKDLAQIRYIDEKGDELVRVDYDNNKDKTKTISLNELQNKKDKYYFTEVMKLAEGRVYVSPLDLNREGVSSGIEIPYKPTIRYATPVFDEDGNRKGVIIINVLASTFLDLLRESRLLEEKVLLLDRDGFYSVNPQRDKEWGGTRDLGTGENFYNDYPDLASRVLTGESGSIIRDQDIEAYAPVIFNDQNEEQFGIIVEVTPKDKVLAPIRLLEKTLFAIGFVSVGLIILLAFLVSYSIARPIAILRKGSEIIKKGNLNHRIKIKSKDELGALSQSFNAMARAVKKSRADVDKKVEEQTRDIIKKKVKLEKQQEIVLDTLGDIRKEKLKVNLEKTKLEAITSNIGDAVFAVDQKNRIILFNKTAEKLSGYREKEVLDEPFGPYLKFLDEKTGRDNSGFINKAIQSGDAVEMKPGTVLRSKTGKMIPVADSASPIKDNKGKIIGCVVVFRDITREREIEKMKDEFLSIASHELRTPMTAIKGFLDMVIKGELGKVSNPDIEEYLKLAYDGNDRMISLVNDMLDVSRIEAGRMKFILEDIQIEKIIQDSVTELTEIARPAKLYLKFKKPKKSLSKIIAAQDKVRMVLSNLIGNAIKFTDKGGVTVLVKEKEKDIIVDVKDTGTGIPKKDLKKLFKKFSQVDASISRSGKGTGLGLYISKRIVDKLGGKIWIDSKGLGKGTTVSFSIPVKGSSASKISIMAIKKEASSTPDQK